MLAVMKMIGGGEENVFHEDDDGSTIAKSMKNNGNFSDGWARSRFDGCGLRIFGVMKRKTKDRGPTFVSAEKKTTTIGK